MKHLNKALFCSCIFFLLIGCKKDPEPISGFNEAFYVKFDFQGEEIKIEENDIIFRNSWAPDPVSSFSNSFKDENQQYRISLRLEFDKLPIDKSDIENLEGKTIPTNESSFPWMRFFITDNQSDEGYATGLNDIIEYGPSNLQITEVIKGPRIDVGDERKRSYIIRGEFEFNISESWWSVNIPYNLYPVTNGEFSMRVYIP